MHFAGSSLLILCAQNVLLPITNFLSGKIPISLGKLYKLQFIFKFSYPFIIFRYELCFTGEKMVRAMQSSLAHEPDSEKSQNHHSHSANGERNDSENIVIDAFRWSRCKKPLPQKVMRSVGIPLPSEYVEVLNPGFPSFTFLHNRRAKVKKKKYLFCVMCLLLLFQHCWSLVLMITSLDFWPPSLFSYIAFFINHASYFGGRVSHLYVENVQ